MNFIVYDTHLIRYCLNHSSITTTLSTNHTVGAFTGGCSTIRSLQVKPCINDIDPVSINSTYIQPSAYAALCPLTLRTFWTCFNESTSILAGTFRTCCNLSISVGWYIAHLFERNQFPLTLTTKIVVTYDLLGNTSRNSSLIYFSVIH